MKTKFGKIITAVLMLCLAFAVCMAMTACNKTVDKLTSELGVVIEGEFDKGAQLVTEPVEVTGETGKNVIALLEEKEYAKEGEVRIFDISVVKDGSKVQPSGKVKVTLAAPFESESGYVTFHIKDDNSVEELKTTYADGKITFETDGFSYFVIAEKVIECTEHNYEGAEWIEGQTGHFKNCAICHNAPTAEEPHYDLTTAELRPVQNAPNARRAVRNTASFPIYITMRARNG